MSLDDLSESDQREITSLYLDLKRRAATREEHYFRPVLNRVRDKVEEGDLESVRAYEKFLSPSRSIVTVDWAMVVLHSYPNNPRIMDISEEQLDAFSRIDIALGNIKSARWAAYDSDTLSLMVLHNPAVEGPLLELVKRGITDANVVKEMLAEMKNHPDALRDGVL